MILTSPLSDSAVFTPRDDLEFILRFEHSDVEVGGPLYLATQTFPAPFISHTNPGGHLRLRLEFAAPLRV